MEFSYVTDKLNIAGIWTVDKNDLKYNGVCGESVTCLTGIGFPLQPIKLFNHTREMEITSRFPLTRLNYNESNSPKE